MSILVYLEGNEGEIKKSSLEASSYAAELASKFNSEAIGILIGEYSDSAIESIGNFGLKKVLSVKDAKLTQPLTQPYASVIAEAAGKVGAKVVVMAKTAIADAIAARLSVKLNAGVATNVTELPEMTNGFKVKRNIYTGKASAYAEISSDIKIITVAKNAFPVVTIDAKAAVEAFQPNLKDDDFKVKVKEVQKASGDILLTEADIVVSGGRGLKGPENWPMLLDLASSLGAATGCSKPVSDLDWRPHHEHVGQTGIKVSPNIYIAIGISGAIQHLAGVNSSKVIVVINNDPEAPFFKAADYGIAGDLFEILPKLTAAAKALK